MVKIKIELEKSFIGVTKKYIIELEKNFPSLNFKSIKNETDFHTVCLAYFDIYKRLVPSTPRKVVKSEEFYCPVRCREGLKKLEKLINNGQGITPYLSKGVKHIRAIRTKKNKTEVINLDSLLNALNIHHLHLGEKYESDGFISRTGPILLCLFTDRVAYFILTLRHGERKAGASKRKPGQKEYYIPWSKQFIIEIINKNWPELLKQRKINFSLSGAISDEDYNAWTKGNINVGITTSDSTTFATMKTLSGDNLHNVLWCQRLAKIIDKLEENIHKNIDTFSENMTNYYISKKIKKLWQSNLEFAFVEWSIINGRFFFVIEEKKTKVILIYQGDFNPQVKIPISKLRKLIIRLFKRKNLILLRD